MAVVKQSASMTTTQLIAARVAPETKAAFRALADRQQSTESSLLKRMIDLAVQSACAGRGDVLKPAPRETRHARLCVRLRSEDQLLLRERAAARQMAAATYVSVLVRAHLRSLSPLPKDELLALKRSIAELGAIGRNLNQIARVANQIGQVTGPQRADVFAFLKVCEALHSNVKSLLKTNLKTWEVGYPEAKF